MAAMGSRFNVHTAMYHAIFPAHGWMLQPRMGALKPKTLPGVLVLPYRTWWRIGMSFFRSEPHHQWQQDQLTKADDPRDHRPT